jgi:hypothetical protein
MMVCDACGRGDVGEREDGLLRNHRDANGYPCKGSRTQAVERRDRGVRAYELEREPFRAWS